MRTLQLNNKEIAMICESLQLFYNQKLDLVENNRKLLTDTETTKILEDADNYAALSESIEDGRKDV